MEELLANAMAVEEAESAKAKGIEEGDIGDCMVSH